MNFVIIGFKAAGKSFVGRRLAQRLNMPFKDIDDIIFEIYEKEYGERLNSREIYKKHGKDFFRELEHRAVEEASKMDGIVLALGGGTLIYFNNAEFLKKNSKLIYLDEDSKAMLERIKGRGIPAFLDPDDLEGSMQRELEKRKPIYEKNADYRLDIKGFSIEEIVNKIIPLLEADKVL